MGSRTALHVVGGTHVTIPAFTPAGFLEALERERVEATLLVPTMIQLIVDHPAMQPPRHLSLEPILYGASPISEAVIERAMAALPASAFVPGLRDDRAVAGGDRPPGRVPHGRGTEARQDPLGRPGRPATEVRIVDLDGVEVPRGKVGEIAVRGPSMMLGYWNKPEETRAAIRDGWMHTGDAGRMDDEGFVFIVDRLKDMIITGGENVYSAEVENALAVSTRPSPPAP